MIKISTKKVFLYISLSLVLSYFVFVLFAYVGQSFSELYSLESCGIYYMVVYIFLVATSYFFDTQSRKEPALLILFALPAYTLIFLSGLMIIGKTDWQYIVVLFLVVSLLYILGYYCYKKWIEKILLIKNGYENILMIYVMIHLFIVLFIAFKIIGLL